MQNLQESHDWYPRSPTQNWVKLYLQQGIYPLLGTHILSMIRCRRMLLRLMGKILTLLISPVSRFSRRKTGHCTFWKLLRFHLHHTSSASGEENIRIVIILHMIPTKFVEKEESPAMYMYITTIDVKPAPAAIIFDSLSWRVSGQLQKKHRMM